MGLLLFMIYIFVTIFLIMCKKSIFSVTIVYLIFAPDIKFGGNDISAIYCLIVYLVFFLLVSRKTLNINKNCLGYFCLIFFNFILYFLMTIVCNYKITNSGIASIVGFFKIPCLIILLCSLFSEEIKKIKNYALPFKVLLLINAIGVFLQFVFGLKVKPFFESMYLTNNYAYYSTLSGWEVYNRKFGFFASPMLLGMFCLFSFLFFWLSYKKNRKVSNLVWTILSLVIGITSLSKTFIIGVPIIIIFVFLFMNKKDNDIKLKNKKNFLILCIFLPIILFSFSKLYVYLKETTTLTYYIQMLNNPFKALETRYNVSSDDLLLTETYNVIKENLFLGVGFQSVNDEFLGDSTYVMALHHGGIVSLISIVLFYIVNIINAFKYKKTSKLLFVFMWMISGLAMPTMYNTILVLPFYLFFFNSKDVSKVGNNEIY